MKIYFYRYGSICEPDIIESFKRIGLSVDEELAEVYNKSITPLQCVNLVSPKLLNNNYAFVFTINFFPWLSDVCKITNTVYISLIVDSPVLELYSKSLRNSCNRIFLFDKMLYNEFAPKNPDCVFHIPLATNVTRTDALISNTPAKDKSRFACDISFIGSTYQEKCAYNKVTLPDYERGFAEGLIETQLKIYGYNFLEEAITDEFADNFLAHAINSAALPEGYEASNKAIVAQHYLSVKVAEQERLRILRMLSDSFNVDIYTGSDTDCMPNIHNRGFAKSLEEMPLIFNQSKINLNITAKSIRSGLSLRIFDVLGSGGFLITNYQAELSDFFEIGTDLVAYDSMENLYELCEYYLCHDEERETIAKNGYEKVKKLHNYDMRLLQIINLSFPAK